MFTHPFKVVSGRGEPLCLPGTTWKHASGVTIQYIWDIYLIFIPNYKTYLKFYYIIFYKIVILMEKYISEEEEREAIEQGRRIRNWKLPGMQYFSIEGISTGVISVIVVKTALCYNNSKRWYYEE